MQTNVSSMCQVDDFRFTSPRRLRYTSGPYRWVQRQILVWSTDRPRSRMSSSTSRRLKENRQYQRTQVTITTGSNLRFQNSGGRQELMSPHYQTRSAKHQTAYF